MMESRKRNIRDLTCICYQYYLQLLAPTSPVYVGKSNCGGLGLFTKKKTSIANGKVLLADTIWGLLFEVTEEDFVELKNDGYISLYEDTGKYVVCGPLSLVNHCCDHNLGFTKKLDSKSPAEEFDGIPILHIKNCYKTMSLQKNDEILANYDGQFQLITYFGENCQWLLVGL